MRRYLIAAFAVTVAAACDDNRACNFEAEVTCSYAAPNRDCDGNNYVCSTCAEIDAWLYMYSVSATGVVDLLGTAEIDGDACSVTHFTIQTTDEESVNNGDYVMALFSESSDDYGINSIREHPFAYKVDQAIPIADWFDPLVSCTETTSGNFTASLEEAGIGATELHFLTFYNPDYFYSGPTQNDNVKEIVMCTPIANAAKVMCTDHTDSAVETCNHGYTKQNSICVQKKPIDHHHHKRKKKMRGGTIVGIVIAVLFVFAIVLCSYHTGQLKKKKEKPQLAHSADLHSLSIL